MSKIVSEDAGAGADSRRIDEEEGDDAAGAGTSATAPSSR